MTRCATPRRRGFTLAEAVAALVLLSAFAAAATPVLRTSLRAPREREDAATRHARFDAALGQLRRDAWGAGKFDVTDVRNLRIERPARPAVTWSVTDDGSLVRTLAQQQQQQQQPADAGDESDAARREWPGVAKGVTFAADGPVLALVEPAGPDGQARRVPLISQILLTGAGREGR